MSGTVTESVQRLVLMEADLARLLETPPGTPEEPAADNFAELMARLIGNQRQIIETLVAMSDELAGLKAAIDGAGGNHE